MERGGSLPIDMKLSLRSILLCTVLTLSGVIAQEPTTPTPASTGDTAIPIPQLRKMLVPMTQSELQGELEAWISLVRAKAGEVSAAEIAAMNQDGEGANSDQEALNSLLSERGRLVDRANVVVDALEEKGGDTSEQTAYLDAVSGLSLELHNAKQTVGRFQGWLLSADGGIQIGLNILAFLVTLVLARLVASLVSRIVRKSVDRAKGGSSELFRDFIVTTVRKLVTFVGVVVALSFIQVEIGPFLAAIGAVGFIVGFALQGTLNNFAAGLMILFHRPYDVGDVVSAGGITGKVDSMSMGSTVFKTADNQTVIVPNGSIWGGVITNVTGNETRRVDLVFGIGYTDDIDKAESVLRSIVENHPKVLADPAPVIKLHELADSSVNFVCRPWTKTADYWDVYWDVTRAVKEQFDREGLSIPFPQQDVHMHQVS